MNTDKEITNKTYVSAYFCRPFTFFALQMSDYPVHIAAMRFLRCGIRTELLNLQDNHKRNVNIAVVLGKSRASLWILPNLP